MANSSRPTGRPLVRGTLARDEWFSHFDQRTLERFAEQGDVVSLKAGQMLSRRGDPVTALCVVIEGALDVSHTATSGKRHVWSYLGPGQVVNLIPVLDEQCAIHDTCAHTDATVLLIPKTMFLEEVDREPRMARMIMRLLCLRSRMLYEHASDNALLPLRARCARMLLILMNTHGIPRPSGMAISLRLSQDEFADMLGRTRQSVNRELKQFEKDGIIAMTYSHFIVQDEAALRAVIAT